MVDTASRRGTRGGATILHRALFGLGVAAVSLLVTLLVWEAGASVFGAALAGGVLAGLAATLAGIPTPARAASATPPMAVADAVPSAAPPAAVPQPAVEVEARRLEAGRSLRHDLRGILSPALLTADRLLMVSEDPAAKRAAQSMIDAVERAEQRLRRSDDAE